MKIRKYHKWTPEQEQMIRDTAGTLTKYQLAEMIGTNTDSIKSRASILGIPLLLAERKPKKPADEETKRQRAEQRKIKQIIRQERLKKEQRQQLEKKIEREKKESFETRPVDLTGKIKLLIRPGFEVYIRPDQDPEEVKAKFANK